MSNFKCSIISLKLFIFFMDTCVPQTPAENITSCKPGYHGRFCTEVCRYPNYGYLCQEGCTCSQEYCHHITGCLNSDLNIGHSVELTFLEDVTHNTAEGQSIIKETSKPVPELSTLMNDNIYLAHTSDKIQSAIKRTQSTVKNACLKGYYGINCSKPCRFPSYGEGCQSKCFCPQKDCHHITGCSIKDGTISTTTSTWAEYSKRTSEKVFMSTSAVQEDKKDPCQRLPLYVCFAIISLLAVLNMFLLVRFRKNIRRAVKTEHVKKNEHEYDTVRSQLRSEAMYTIPQRNEGENYLELA